MNRLWPKFQGWLPVLSNDDFLNQKNIETIQEGVEGGRDLFRFASPKYLWNYLYASFLFLVSIFIILTHLVYRDNAN